MIIQVNHKNLYQLPLHMNQMIINIFKDCTDGEFVTSEYEAIQKYLKCPDIIPVISKRRVPWSSVISEYKDGKILYNPRKYASMTELEIIGNLVHESFHHLGYGHAFEWNPTRKYSIPYFLGYYVAFKLKYKEASHEDFLEYIKNIK